MKTSHLVATLIVTAAFSLALAGEAQAKGACVYVKNETFQCDQLASSSSCSQKAPGGLGEFHADTTCKNIGYGVSWGIAKPPPPPAKASFSGASFAADVPPIPSPLQKDSKKRMRF